MTRGSIQARGCVLPTDVLLYLCFRVTGAKLRPRSVGFCDSCPINPDASTQAHLQEQGLTLIKKKRPTSNRHTLLLFFQLYWDIDEHRTLNIEQYWTMNIEHWVNLRCTNVHGFDTCVYCWVIVAVGLADCLHHLTYLPFLFGGFFFKIYSLGNFQVYSRVLLGWCWRTGKPGVLQSMGSQRFGQDWATEQQLLSMRASSRLKRSRQWHPTPVLLPGESHGRRSLVGCSPWGR